MTETLEQIKSDYIIFMLDDFFLYDFVHTEEVEKCIEYFKKNSNIATFTFYPLYMQSKPSKYVNYNKKEKGSRYKVSALIGIWKKKKLQKYLRGYKENIWEWEKNATERSNKLYPKDEFYVMKCNTQKVFPYDPSNYGLFSGKWLTPTKKIFEKLNIDIDFSKRGFYNEALRGLEKSIIASFEMESGVMPYYALTHKKSSYLKCNNKFKTGKFIQEYNIFGARNIVRWEPSVHWGFGIKNLKIKVIYENKEEEEIKYSELFGAFIKQDNMYIFNKPGAYMLIPTIEDKIISKLIIKGEVIFPLTKDLLEKSYDKETISNNPKYIEASQQLWNEFFTAKEKLYHIDFNPECYASSLRKNEKEKLEGKNKIHRKRFTSEIYLEKKYASIDWKACQNLGYAIKNLKIIAHMKNNKNKKLTKEYVRDIPYKSGKLLFFRSTTEIHFDIPYENTDKIVIKGKFICPAKSKQLRKIIYGK